MIFRRRARRTLAVDVGTSHVKVAEVDHSGEEPRLLRLGLRALAPEPTADGEARGGDGDRTAAAATAVRSLLASFGVARRQVVCAVGGRDVIVKAVRMDRMSAEESEDAIRWEAGRHVPHDLDDVELDVHVVDPGREGPRMTVVLAAARRRVVRERIRLLEAAGLEPTVVDVEPLALHNCLRHNHPESAEGVVGLAAIGHRHTSFHVSYDGTPILVREVPFGTGRLRRALRDGHGLSPEGAEAVLRGREMGAAEAALRDLGRRAERLAYAVQRTSDFLDGRRPGTRVGRLYVCGGGARLPRLRRLLADRLGVEAIPANPLQLLPSAPGALDGVDAEGSLPLFGAAVGMAIRRP